MSITPNMLLDLPDVGVTTGPEWATKLLDALDRVDLHDHSANYGARVTASGINVDADFTFNNFNATDLRTTRFVSLGSTPSNPNDLQIAYVKNGELAYRDALGQEVVITANGSVAGATGTITGLTSPASASYSGVTKTFTVFQDTSKPAKLNTSDILIYENNNATANPITLKSPAAVAGAYSLTLPATLPASTSFLNVDVSGNMASVAATGTGSVVLATSATLITPTITNGTLSGTLSYSTLISPQIYDPTFYNDVGGKISSGQFTPTFVAVTGTTFSPSASFVFRYLRINNVIYVTGLVTGTSDGSGNLSCTMTLPIIPTSNFSASTQLVGNCALGSTSATGKVGIMQASSGAKTALLTIQAAASGTYNGISVQFAYTTN